jgi:hypothetical protein
MASDELTARLAQLRVDFQAEKGYSFKHFYCPFLHVDEPAELCEGHVVNEKLETCNAWVPQRRDFDSFYGSIAEVDFISAVQDRFALLMERRRLIGQHP